LSKLTFIPVEGNFKHYFCLKSPFREEFVDKKGLNFYYQNTSCFWRCGD
jgi:hypothetical protein